MHSIRVCRVNFQRLKYSLEIYPASDAHEICRLDSIYSLEGGKCTKLSEIMVGKVGTQCVAAAGRSEEAGFTSGYYKGNRP